MLRISGSPGKISSWKFANPTPVVICHSAAGEIAFKRALSSKMFTTVNRRGTAEGFAENAKECINADV